MSRIQKECKEIKIKRIKWEWKQINSNEEEWIRMKRIERECNLRRIEIEKNWIGMIINEWDWKRLKGTEMNRIESELKGMNKTQ